MINISLLSIFEQTLNEYYFRALTFLWICHEFFLVIVEKRYEFK